jgi:alpha-1,3-rhamnosyl/mannosyltransferase
MDVVHGLDQRAPRWHRAIRASTIHDILWELPICKEWGDFVTAGREHARLTGLIHNVDHFITLSQATKCDLVNQRGVDPERISVIRPGVEPIFCPRSATSHTPFTKRYGLHRPFILHVGLCDPRKNIARLVDGFSASGLWRDFDLVLIGRRGRGWPAVEKEINTLCMNDYVRSLDYIDSKHLPFLYSAAEALALPSLHEGFGLPILESMASGVPVVTSNRPGMTEAAGGHAILIDPKDPGDIASGLIAAIDMPRDKREEARFYALKHQWEDTARRHLALYRRIIDDRGFRLTNGLP